VSRGCVLEKDSGLQQADGFRAEILWMDDAPLTVGKNFLVKLGTKKIPGVLTRIDYAIDINTGAHEQKNTLKKNEIAVCELAVTEPVVIDLFTRHRTQGEFILIDRISHNTAACGVVQAIGTAGAKQHLAASRGMRAALNWQKLLAVVFSPDDERAEDAVSEAEYRLVRAGRHTYLYRPQSGEDAAAVVRHLLDAGLVVLVETDTPQAADVLADSLPEAKRWSALPSDGTSAEAITQAVLQASLLSTVLSPNNWII
jgi:sulfate adenylyltransferase subunit 1